VHRYSDLLKVFGFLQLGIGFSALASLPLFGRIPFVNRWIFESLGAEFTAIQFSNFFIIFSLLILPTFFMGAQFPVVVKLVARDLATLGHSVGKVYASNTVGTIFGSFLAGFVLIPGMGIQNTVLATVLLNVALGVILLTFAPTLRFNLKAYALPGLLILGLWGARSVDAWDKAV
ncbi:MAG: spermidine synthase, partial [Nitrospinaceae bacterium]|nr:spermidine synthase [Nitrospinaceae bacterium]NIR57500.1 spermidine synthase [Nitrospinaceae bacterium]NIT84835.1 spermidine synthase [Nitrospinaceae bacterium]NIU47015.1 spermidine synthase [Nitrospinaceae bacterium]NIU99216.1 spermidine synthase [Nitrospinaceae bacterium]